VIETHVLTHGNLLDHHACFAMADSKSQSITSSGVVAFDSTSKTLANVPERVSLLYPTAFLNFNAPSPEEWPAAKRSEIHALFTFGEPRISGSTLDLYPNLKIVCNFGNGVDHIDLAAAKQRGILVGNTPDAPAASTADLALGLIIACARNIVTGDAYARAADTVSFSASALMGQQVSGQRIGIVGFGRIGQLVARRAIAFDMSVLYHSRHRVDEAVEQQYKAQYRSLDDLLAQADFVVLCCPLSPETRHLISAPQLALMKRSAILVNVARGGVVDTTALTAALSARQIWSAGLDVTDPEPLPRDHPLLKLSNVIISPHIGSATAQTRNAMGDDAIANLTAALKGLPIPNRVV